MPEQLYRAIRDFAKGQHERVRSSAVLTASQPGGHQAGASVVIVPTLLMSGLRPCSARHLACPYATREIDAMVGGW
jgi:hypothetical protein